MSDPLVATAARRGMLEPIRRLVAQGSEDPHLRELVRRTLIAFAAKAGGAAATFALGVLLAHLLGPAEVGLYFLASSILYIASVAGRVGLDDALIRFTAGSFGLGDWDAIRGVHRLAMRMLLVASLLASAALFAGADWLATVVFHKPALAPVLRWGAAATLPFALLSIQGELLKGVSHILASQVVQGVVAPVITLLLIVAVGARSARAAVAAYAVGCAATALLGWWLWRRATPQLRTATPNFALSRLLSSSVPAYGVALLAQLLGWSGTILIGIWCSSAEVALYSLAARMAFLTNFILIAISSMVAPQFAALYRHGDRDALRSLARQSTLLVVLLNAPLLALFGFGARLAMSLYGPQYLAAAPMLVILTIGQTVNVATGAVHYLLMMSGHERLQRNNHLVTALVTLGLSMLLIPRYGGIGAAIATSAGLVVLNGTGAVLAYRRLGILVFPLPRRRRATP